MISFIPEIHWFNDAGVQDSRPWFRRCWQICPYCAICSRNFCWEIWSHHWRFLPKTGTVQNFFRSLICSVSMWVVAFPNLYYMVSWKNDLCVEMGQCQISTNTDAWIFISTNIDTDTWIFISINIGTDTSISKLSLIDDQDENR